MKKALPVISAILLLASCGTTAAVQTMVTGVPVVEDRPISGMSALIDEVPFSQPPPFTEISGDVVERFPSGEVDWSDNMVRATGSGVVDMANPNRGQARLMAERAAVVVAQRNLLEIVEGVRVNSETRVVNFMTDYDVVHTRVEGLVRNARQVGPARFDEELGIVEVDLEMELHNPQGLSGALGSALSDNQIDPQSLSPQVRDFLRQYSGLVIDGGQTGLAPSMFPRIFDENGNLLLDTSQYASMLGAGGGMALQFVSDLEGLLGQAGMPGSPLVLQAVQAAGQFGSDIVLSVQDAGRGGGILKDALPFLLGAGRFLMKVLL
jgi:hypothetical protein